MTNITVSLEKAKKLKEAGWDKETYFTKSYHTCGEEETHSSCCSKCNVNRPGEFTDLQFPTAQELLDELPRKVKTKNGEGVLTLHKEKVRGGIEYGVGRKDGRCRVAPRYSSRDSPEDALVKAWIRCKENGYLSTDNKEDV